MTENRRANDVQLVMLEQKLDTHINEFHSHRKADEARWENLIEAQEHNTKCIEELIHSTQKLTDSTKDIIAAWNAANGTVRTMSALGNFIKWLSSVAVIGVAITWVLERMPK